VLGRLAWFFLIFAAIGAGINLVTDGLLDQA
jgi:hypothetical protein